MSFICKNTINTLFAYCHHEDVIFDSEFKRFSFKSSIDGEILHCKIRLNKYTRKRKTKLLLPNDRNKSHGMEVLNIIV